MEGQLALSFISHDEGAPPILIPTDPPQQVTHRGLVWYLVDHEANQRRGSKRSVVWDIGNHYIAVSDPSKWAWRCQLCRGNMIIQLTNSSTAAAIRHLQKQHPNHPLLSDDVSSTVTSTEISTPEGLVQSTIKTTINVNKFRYHLLRWIVNKQTPFDEVEDEDFKEMLLSLSPTIDRNLVQSSQTIRN
jgi:hypothetical protein